LVYGDKARIKQSLINLTENALAYSGEGGTITLACEQTPAAVRISVRHSGRGIPPEDLPQVCERFYRVDKSRSQLTGGMGIGLAITKAIAEAHGGGIRVTSALGTGSEFTITLPPEE
jgi:signal transduction histidine kinase